MNYVTNPDLMIHLALFCHDLYVTKSLFNAIRKCNFYFTIIIILYIICLPVPIHVHNETEHRVGIHFIIKKDIINMNTFNFFIFDQFI